MAKQQRGSTRATNRPATPPPATRPQPNRPSGQRRPGQANAWQPNRVSSTTTSSKGPNRTLLMTIGSIVVGVLIVGFVALQQLGGSSAPTANAKIIAPGAANSIPASIPTNGRTLGDPNAPVTIDIYGDFRCSACYQFTEGGTESQVVSQLVAPGKAKVVWHDYLVIDADGSNVSRDAANAAWCAADQGKFWTMHDWLYANQTSEAPSVFPQDRLLKIGQAAGLDMTAFTTCVQNGTHFADIANEEANIPAAARAHGTPSIMIDGNLVNATFTDIQTAVEKASGSAAPSGSAPASPAASPSGS